MKARLWFVLLAVVWLASCTASQPEPSPSPQTIAEIDRGRQIACVQALKGDGELAGEVIKVTARGTTITLDGTVQTADEKERADRLAHSIRGVEKVENHLEVKPR